jgi:K+-transporting ATPase KdpF subunit
MEISLLVAGVLCAAVVAYLAYALVRPERF